MWTLKRARVAERLGDPEQASRDYQYVANVWRHADPKLRTYVTEAREGPSQRTSDLRKSNYKILHRFLTTHRRY